MPAIAETHHAHAAGRSPQGIASSASSPRPLHVLRGALHRQGLRQVRRPCASSGAQATSRGTGPAPARRSQQQRGDDEYALMPRVEAPPVPGVRRSHQDPFRSPTSPDSPEAMLVFLQKSTDLCHGWGIRCRGCQAALRTLERRGMIKSGGVRATSVRRGPACGARTRPEGG